MFQLWSDAGYMDHEPVAVTWVADQIVAWAGSDEPAADVLLVEEAA